MGFIDFIINVYQLLTFKRDLKSVKEHPQEFIGCALLGVVLLGFVLIIWLQQSAEL